MLNFDVYIWDDLPALREKFGDKCLAAFTGPQSTELGKFHFHKTSTASDIVHEISHCILTFAKNHQWDIGIKSNQQETLASLSHNIFEEINDYLYPKES